MAIIIPPLDVIYLQKVKPQKGEIHLLNFLTKILDNSFEVYFNPFLNGDRPDIVIMRKGFGVMIIEVKDYDLSLYKLDERKNFVIKTDNSKTNKSPIQQVLKYKENLFELHVEKLLEKKINDIRNFNTVRTAVFFSKASLSQIHELLVEPYQEDRRYMDFIKHNIDFFGCDNLNEIDFIKCLKSRHLISNRPSELFTDEIYYSFLRFLQPPLHYKKEGKEIRYSPKQKEIIYEKTKNEQRIKGVVGSGKTTVLAARAVQAHRRTGTRVLILTYNITLKNYIKEKINEVRDDFSWDAFVILNYHLFINSELNNLEVSINVPEDFDERSSADKSAYFEKTYYSNKELFRKYKGIIVKYDVILIDEIQDYKRSWMEIIKEFFLAENGEYVLFGDVKQNIYNNKTDGKDVSTNVRGVVELKNCFRSDLKIKDLAIRFQKEIFKQKYELDSFDKNSDQKEIEFERQLTGRVNYIYMPEAASVSSLYTIIHQNAINQNIQPNDIAVLSNSISLLKQLDVYYRYLSHEKTNTMFETPEMLYKMGFNFISKDAPDWLRKGMEIFNQNKEKASKPNLNKLSVLFAIYDLYLEFKDRFEPILSFYCKKYKIQIQNFLDYVTFHKEEIDLFREAFCSSRLQKNIEIIRNNKKLHFHFNSGTIKISTIHSFKGWEAETVFLILEDEIAENTPTIDEILYTGLTRSRANLILINYGNQDYHNKLIQLVNDLL